MLDRELAEEVAENIILDHARDIEALSIREMTRDLTEDSNVEDIDELIEYVTYLIWNSKILIKLPKERL